LTRFAAFLRAINVGGRTVKMERLRSVFESVKLRDVSTVINSGNVLFVSGAKDTGALERRLEKALEAELGYEVVTFVRSAEEVAAVARRKDFTDVPSGDLVQVGFLKEAPSAAARRAVAALATDRDELVVHGRELHWHVRGRTMDSQVKAKALADALGGPTTVRSITTVRRIAGLLAEE
jgi:uncharacterized protein (DUF1697 family)